MWRAAAVATPATGVIRRSLRNALDGTKHHMLQANHAAPLLMLELDRPQSVSHPLVQLSSDFEWLRQSKEGLPAQQVGPSFSPTCTMLHPRETDERLEILKRGCGHTTFDYIVIGHRQRIPRGSRTKALSTALLAHLILCLSLSRTAS